MSNLPKPAALKVLQGTDRADRRNPAEPKPAIGAKPPPWLPRTGPARSAWRRLAPVLTAARVLTVADAEALALACLALSDFLEARADANGWRRADAAWKRYSGMLVQFGMTPSARTRVAAVPAEEADPLAAWMASAPSEPPPPPPAARRKPATSTTPPADPLAAWQAGYTPEGPA